MSRDFLREGSHSWDLTCDYHLCPACKKIVENRTRYERRYGKLQVDLTCTSCQHPFTVTKQVRASFGPLTGR